ncbi:MAG TPA: hypothetical protein VLF90_01150 [Patescibacteria group bacterium]|nr:hypothetical protein [Patescibacteria group bacterium]
MANFLLLYKGGGMPTTDEEKKKSLDEWAEWMKQCGDALVDPGNPCSNSKSVSKSGESDVKGELVTGYSVIKADSMEHALKAASMVPLVVDGSGSCDVYETFAAM